MRSVVLLLSLLSAMVAAQTNCGGTPNNNPIYTGSPVFVSSVANGTRWSVGPATLNPKLNVIHIYGSAYNMGLAYGSLMQAEISVIVNETFAWIDSQINQYLGSLPKNVVEWIDQYGVPGALNLTYMATKPYTPQHFYDTVQGIADGSGQSFDTLIQLSMFPELIKAQCSIFGAWSAATEYTTSEVVQLRALDWSTNGPFQQFPLLIHYHPLADDGHAFSVLTWPGLVGAITGYSSANVGISEKVWDGYMGVQNIFGYPFHFLLQDILQYDIDTDQALSRIASANRTCSIWIGIGDSYNNEAKIVAYSNQIVEVYNDRNFPAYPPVHPLMEGLVFVDKHVQPSGDPCFGSLLTMYYGSIDPAMTIQNIVSVAQTGDMHVAVYDYAAQMMYIANALPMNASGYAAPAYSQPFIQVNMDLAWNLQYSADGSI